MAVVDVDSRAGDRGVGHEGDGQDGDVGRAGEAAGPACREQAGPDGRDLEGEALGQGGKRGGERRGERGARRGGTGGEKAGSEQQGAWRADLARGAPGDLQRQQEMGVDGAAVRVEAGPSRRRAAGGGDQHVVDGRG